MKISTLATEHGRSVTGRVLMGVLLGAALLFHVWLLWARWINPDEGAHLMDSRLASQGLVPGVDFDARQPLYTYAYVPFLELFGSGIVSGRLLPLVCTWLAGGVIFLIGRRLWDGTHGVVAAVLFLGTPTILVNASLVKMEPLAVLVTAAAFYALIRYLKEGYIRWLVATGVFFGIGYYVRESTVAGLAAATVVLLLSERPWRRTCLRLGALYSGAAAVGLVLLVSYAQFQPWREVIADGGLNPAYRVWTTVHEIVVPAVPAASAVGAEPVPEVLAAVRLSAQSTSGTLVNLLGVVRLNAPLIMGCALAVLVLGTRLVRGLASRSGLPWDLTGFTVIVAWLLSFSALYAFFALKRGFFQFYFRELIPPLALLAAWTLIHALDSLGQRRNALLWLGGSLAGLIGVFFVQREAGTGGMFLGIGALAFFSARVARRDFATVTHLAAFLSGVFVLLVGLEWMGQARGSGTWERWWEWVWLAAIAGAGVGWLRIWAPATLSSSRWKAVLALASLGISGVGVSAYGASRLGIAYDCVWPRDVLRRTVELIETHSRPGDSVASGAVIWEFEAGREPFARITHPLAFRDSLRREVPPAVMEALRTHPPQLIILDGYTEQTYFRRIPEMKNLVEKHYVLVGTVAGAEFPVEVYKYAGSSSVASP